MRLPIVVPIIGVVGSLLGLVLLYAAVATLLEKTWRGVRVQGRVVGLFNSSGNPMPEPLTPGFELSTADANAVDKQLGELTKVVQFVGADGAFHELRTPPSMPTKSLSDETVTVWYDPAHPEKEPKVYTSPVVILVMAIVALVVGGGCLILTFGFFAGW
jgi:hypothetical protein